MKQPRPGQPEVVAHPGGGMTLAVPVGHGSTVRIYHGMFQPGRRRRKRRTKP
jgi:hypothetical protein